MCTLFVFCTLFFFSGEPTYKMDTVTTSRYVETTHQETKRGETLGETDLKEDGNVRQKYLFPIEAQPTKFFFLRFIPILVRIFFKIWGLLCKADETMYRLQCTSESRPTLLVL